MGVGVSIKAYLKKLDDFKTKDLEVFLREEKRLYRSENQYKDYFYVCISLCTGLVLIFTILIFTRLWVGFSVYRARVGAVGRQQADGGIGGDRKRWAGVGSGG